MLKIDDQEKVAMLNLIAKELNINSASNEIEILKKAAEEIIKIKTLNSLKIAQE